MFITNNKYLSYKALKAKSIANLEKKMLLLNVNSLGGIEFTAPAFVGEEWITWYHYDYSNDFTAEEKFSHRNIKK